MGVYSSPVQPVSKPSFAGLKVCSWWSLAGRYCDVLILVSQVRKLGDREVNKLPKVT